MKTVLTFKDKRLSILEDLMESTSYTTIPTFIYFMLEDYARIKKEAEVKIMSKIPVGKKPKMTELQRVEESFKEYGGRENSKHWFYVNENGEYCEFLGGNTYDRKSFTEFKEAVEKFPRLWDELSNEEIINLKNRFNFTKNNK
jgi:hypothetical protein